MLFIESTYFSKRLAGVLDDDEYGQLQKYLSQHPENGKVLKQLVSPTSSPASRR